MAGGGSSRIPASRGEEGRREMGRLDAVEKELTVLPFIGHGSGRGRRSRARVLRRQWRRPVIAGAREGATGRSGGGVTSGSACARSRGGKEAESAALTRSTRAVMAEARAAPRGRSGAGKKEVRRRILIRR